MCHSIPLTSHKLAESTGDRAIIGLYCLGWFRCSREYINLCLKLWVLVSAFTQREISSSPHSEMASVDDANMMNLISVQHDVASRKGKGPCQRLLCVLTC